MNDIYFWLTVLSLIISVTATALVVIVDIRLTRMENELRKMRPPAVRRSEDGRPINERL